jgi:hypothetical protein
MLQFRKGTARVADAWKERASEVGELDEQPMRITPLHWGRGGVGV